MKTLCGHLALFEAHTHTLAHTRMLLTALSVCVCACVLVPRLWVTFFLALRRPAQSLLQFENDIRSPLSALDAAATTKTATTITGRGNHF